MKRPAPIGGRPVPTGAGRCALCGTMLGDPRDGTTRLLGYRFRLVCRDERACRARAYHTNENDSEKELWP